MVVISECVCDYVNNPFSEVLSGRLRVLGTIHKCWTAICGQNEVWAVRRRASDFYLLNWTEPDFEWGSACFGRPGLKLGTEVYLLRWARDIEYLYDFILLKTEQEEESFQKIGLQKMQHSGREPHLSWGRVEAEFFEHSAVSTVSII
jgi:hypothetical protein